MPLVQPKFVFQASLDAHINKAMFIVPQCLHNFLKLTDQWLTYSCLCILSCMGSEKYFNIQKITHFNLKLYLSQSTTLMDALCSFQTSISILNYGGIMWKYGILKA